MKGSCSSDGAGCYHDTKASGVANFCNFAKSQKFGFFFEVKSSNFYMVVTNSKLFKMPCRATKKSAVLVVIPLGHLGDSHSHGLVGERMREVFRAFSGTHSRRESPGWRDFSLTL